MRFSGPAGSKGILLVFAILALCGCGIQGMPIPPEQVPPETPPENAAKGTVQKGQGAPGKEPSLQKNTPPPNGQSTPPSQEEDQEEPAGGFPDE